MENWGHNICPALTLFTDSLTRHERLKTPILLQFCINSTQTMYALISWPRATAGVMLCYTGGRESVTVAVRSAAVRLPSLYISQPIESLFMFLYYTRSYSLDQEWFLKSPQKIVKNYYIHHSYGVFLEGDFPQLITRDDSVIIFCGDSLLFVCANVPCRTKMLQHWLRDENVLITNKALSIENNLERKHKMNHFVNKFNVFGSRKNIETQVKEWKRTNSVQYAADTLVRRQSTKLFVVDSSAVLPSSTRTAYTLKTLPTMYCWGFKNHR